MKCKYTDMKCLGYFKVYNDDHGMEHLLHQFKTQPGTSIIPTYNK